MKSRSAINGVDIKRIERKRNAKLGIRKRIIAKPLHIAVNPRSAVAVADDFGNEFSAVKNIRAFAHSAVIEKDISVTGTAFEKFGIY